MEIGVIKVSGGKPPKRHQQKKIIRLLIQQNVYATILEIKINNSFYRNATNASFSLEIDVIKFQTGTTNPTEKKIIRPFVQHKIYASIIEVTLNNSG